MFHRVCGREVQLSRNRRTAKRKHSGSGYDHGVVFSSEPLADGQLFEVRLDEVVRGWSGSIAIGVTKLVPSDRRSIAATAVALSHGTVLAFGREIRVDGVATGELHTNLEELNSGATLGVALLSGHMHLFVNGVDQGVVRRDITSPVRAVVDVYGCCVQVSMTSNIRPGKQLLSMLAFLQRAGRQFLNFF